MNLDNFSEIYALQNVFIKSTLEHIITNNHNLYSIVQEGQVYGLQLTSDTMHKFVSTIESNETK
jgi:hypothetical protein